MFGKMSIRSIKGVERLSRDYLTTVLSDHQRKTTTERIAQFIAMHLGRVGSQTPGSLSVSIALIRVFRLGPCPSFLCLSIFESGCGHRREQTEYYDLLVYLQSTFIYKKSQSLPLSAHI